MSLPTAPGFAPQAPHHFQPTDLPGGKKVDILISRPLQKSLYRACTHEARHRALIHRPPDRSFQCPCTRGQTSHSSCDTRKVLNAMVGGHSWAVTAPQRPAGRQPAPERSLACTASMKKRLQAAARSPFTKMRRYTICPGPQISSARAARLRRRSTRRTDTFIAAGDYGNAGVEMCCCCCPIVLSNRHAARSEASQPLEETKLFLLSSVPGNFYALVYPRTLVPSMMI